MKCPYFLGSSSWCRGLLIVGLFKIFFSCLMSSSPIIIGFKNIKKHVYLHLATALVALMKPTETFICFNRIAVASTQVVLVSRMIVTLSKSNMSYSRYLYDNMRYDSINLNP